MTKLKLNIAQFILSILINSLIGYAFFYFARGNNSILLGIVTTLVLAISGILTTAVNTENKKLSVNTKVLSSVFYFLLFIINLVFMFIKFKSAVYLIVNGAVFLVYLILYVSVFQTKQ